MELIITLVITLASVVRAVRDACLYPVKKSLRLSSTSKLTISSLTDTCLQYLKRFTTWLARSWTIQS